jgi:hypothetical protein
MIPPAGMAIAAMTVMLWILWSDSLRSRRPSPVIYTVRIALYLTAAGVLILNRVRYPALYTRSATIVTLVAVVVGVLGAVFFARKLVARR